MSANSKTVKFFSFSQFHNKKPSAGSTYLRVEQLLKYWDEASLYRYGDKADVMIFQKVYMAADYKFPKNIKAIKILDMCDPDWMSGVVMVKETIDAMDAVTCSSESQAKFLSQLTDTPVVYIPDRFDLELIPKPKRHVGKAKSVVWFGYSHNADLLRPAMKLIDESGLKLIMISNEDNMLYRYASESMRKRYKFVKYDEQTIYKELQKADFAILPKGNRPNDLFKSNNRTIKAILAGLPVAYTPEEVENFMDGKSRSEWIDKHYPEIIKEYDVRKSVEQYKELIEKLC